jgi:hypothetical protein
LAGKAAAAPHGESWLKTPASVPNATTTSNKTTLSTLDRRVMVSFPPAGYGRAHSMTIARRRLAGQPPCDERLPGPARMLIPTGTDEIIENQSETGALERL